MRDDIQQQVLVTRPPDSNLRCGVFSPIISRIAHEHQTSAIDMCILKPSSSGRIARYKDETRSRLIQGYSNLLFKVIIFPAHIMGK
jgi:hypothetical protein